METKTSRTDRVKALHDRLVASIEEFVSGEDWKAMLKISALFHNYSRGGITYSKLLNSSWL
jgi:hypothetical protein